MLPDVIRLQITSILKAPADYWKRPAGPCLANSTSSLFNGLTGITLPSFA
jgi:hypothetical protein